MPIAFDILTADGKESRVIYRLSEVVAYFRRQKTEIGRPASPRLPWQIEMAFDEAVPAGCKVAKIVITERVSS